MAEVDIEQMKNEFTAEFQNLVKVKQLNSFFLSSTQYDERINSVLEAKQSKSLTKLQRRRLKRYDVYTIEGIQKLIVPMEEGDSSIIYYLKNEEIFDVLYDIHVSVGHGGKHRMLHELKKKYKNVTQEMVLLFLKHCALCQMKQKSVKKEIVAKPVGSLEKNSRCRVDFIDMQSSTDDKYNFVMVYEEEVTKFVQLRPLVTKTPKEVANSLLDIFCIFGPPEILQSDIGCKFVDKVIQKLRSKWKGLNIVYNEKQENDEKIYENIENILNTCLNTTNHNQWSKGLNLVQFLINQEYRNMIKTTPFKAMFGSDAKAGNFSRDLDTDDFSNIAELPLSVEILSEDDVEEQKLVTNQDIIAHQNNQSANGDSEDDTSIDNEKKRKRTKDSTSGGQDCNCDTKRCKCKTSEIL